jgi:TPR repeat protein
MKHYLLCSIVLLLASLASSAHAEKRVALVVGNSAYQNVGRLDNPANDASLMADTLRDLGFTLVGSGAQLDLDKAALDGVVQSFGQKIQGADVALFYYAGHGVQVRGSNYLVPVNANPTREADVDFQMVDINLVLNQMQGSGTRLNLVILDACRNNPFGGRGLRSSEGGLAQIRAPEGTLISYATQPGSVAQDGGDGNSPYTKALAVTIRRSGLDIFQTFNEVGLAVKRSTGGSQQPWVSSSPIDGSFYFVSPAVSSVSVPPVTPHQQEARLAEPTDPLRLDLVTDCDRLAANPEDPQHPRSVPGVTITQIDIVPALRACDAAMRQFPDVARFTYQAGRIAASQKDYMLARQLYEKAAAAGEAGSMNNLGNLFLNGQGVPKDVLEAREWYQKAAAAGAAVGMANLGRLYAQGNGVSKNYAEALKWYQKAVAAGDPIGMNGLGYLYEQGTGVPEDLTEARKWYEKAAALGEPNAMSNLGNLYRDGRGVTKNYTEALKWYERAAAAGNANGMNNRGVLSFKGQGVPKDVSEARRWYEKAAAAGAAVAMRNLGAIYAQGNGVARDYNEARKWYEMAAAAGDEPAKTSLIKLELAKHR